MKLKLPYSSQPECEFKRIPVGWDKRALEKNTKKKLIKQYQLGEKDYIAELFSNTLKVRYLKTNETLVIRTKPYFEVLRNIEGDDVIFKFFDIMSAWSEYLAYLLELPYNFVFRMFGHEFLNSRPTAFHNDFLDYPYVDFREKKHGLELAFEDFITLRKIIPSDSTLDYAIRWFGKGIISNAWSEKFLNFCRSIDVISSNEYKGMGTLKKKVSSTLGRYQIEIKEEDLNRLVGYRDKIAHGSLKLEFKKEFMDFIPTVVKISNSVIKNRLKVEYSDIPLQVEYFKN